jgi:hypothetical protein
MSLLEWPLIKQGFMALRTFFGMSKKVLNWDRQRLIRAAATLRERSALLGQIDEVQRTFGQIDIRLERLGSRVFELHDNPGNAVAFAGFEVLVESPGYDFAALRALALNFDPQTTDMCLEALHATEQCFRTCLGLHRYLHGAKGNFQPAHMDPAVTTVREARARIQTLQKELATLRRRMI